MRLVRDNFGEARRTITFENNMNYNIRVTLSGYTYEFVNKWGSFGINNGQFDGPYYLAAAENGMVFVSDWNNNRVQKFSMTNQTEDDGEWTINSTPTASSHLSGSSSIRDRGSANRKKKRRKGETTISNRKEK